MVWSARELAQLAGTTRLYNRLEQARAGIVAILREEASASRRSRPRLSESDSSMVHICGRLSDEEAMADLRRMVEVDAEAGALGKEIDALAADADEATRQRLAERLAPSLAQNLVDIPVAHEPCGTPGEERAGHSADVLRGGRGAVQPGPARRVRARRPHRAGAAAGRPGEE